MDLQLVVFLVFMSNTLVAYSDSGISLLTNNNFLSGDDAKKPIDPDILEDTKLDVIGLLTKYGYPSESHTVQTEDGYLLTMHRITGGKGERQKDRPVAFLMHGLLCSSADWITAGPQTGLGYLLADEGYDVWMGNARGNFYSRKHTSLDPKQSKFWKFTWNEIGYYDLPAMINTVLEKTGQDKLHYIGHSQGTTTFFVMASTRPEYNDKIKSMQALGPAAYMSNLQSPLVKKLSRVINTLQMLFSLIGMNEFLPNKELMTIATNLLCKDNSTFQPVCTNILFLLCGYNPELLNTTMLPVYMAHTPAGASTRQLIHYGQLFRSKQFRNYDYGPIGNLANYGTFSPPNYQLNRVTAPVALHYGNNDWLVDPIDVHQLWTELANPIDLFPVNHPSFNHLDFLWAINVRELLYNRVIDLMNQYD